MVGMPAFPRCEASWPVADRDCIGALDPELLENYPEDVRRRLRFLGVVRRTWYADSHPRNFEVLVSSSFLAEDGRPNAAGCTLRPLLDFLAA